MKQLAWGVILLPFSLMAQYPQMTVKGQDTLITITSKQLTKINVELLKSKHSQELLSDCELALAASDTIYQSQVELTEKLTQQIEDMAQIGKSLNKQLSNQKEITKNQSVLLNQRRLKINRWKTISFFLGVGFVLSLLIN